MRSLQALVVATMGACISAPLAADTPITFHSPSGNIVCYKAGVAGISCLIFEQDWSDAQLAAFQTDYDGECPVDQTLGIDLPVKDRPRLINHCHGDVFWWTDNQFVLHYGFSLQNSEFNCTSEQVGMTCRNRLGHGFTLAHAKYTILSP